MKILVVDVESGVRRTLSTILEDEGYTVMVASDGKEGLERALAEEPDFIFYDAGAPTLDGIEFLSKYHGSGGRSLVIVMSAYGSNELALGVMKRGAYDYLPKPFIADEVLLTLQKSLVREELRGGRPAP